MSVHIGTVGDAIFVPAVEDWEPLAQEKSQVESGTAVDNDTDTCPEVLRVVKIPVPHRAYRDSSATSAVQK